MPAHAPKSSAYLPPCGQRTGHAEHPQPDAGARADDEREQKLSLHVARERVLHPLQQRLAARVRREAPVDARRQPRHVEQHVDRHDDDEQRAEEQRHDREPGAFGPVERLRRVLLDVLRPDRVEELVAAALDVDLLQVMRVQPVLQAREVVIRARLVGLSGDDRKVVVDPVTRVARLLHDDGRQSENCECERCCKRQVHDRDREPARDPHPTQSANNGIEEEGDEQRHEEEEDRRDAPLPPPPRPAAAAAAAPPAAPSAGSRSSSRRGAPACGR